MFCINDKKIKRVFNELKVNQTKIIAQNNELLWSSIFHDSIKGKPHLENLSLNIGRWAGNYAFFYVLNRILNDYQPKRILEFGLGESSKFVSTFLEHELPNSNHLIIEQSEDWKESFGMRFKLFKNSRVVVCPLEQRMIQGFASNFYKDLDTVVDGVEQKMRVELRLYQGQLHFVVFLLEGFFELDFVEPGDKALDNEGYHSCDQGYKGHDEEEHKVVEDGVVQSGVLLAAVYGTAQVEVCKDETCGGKGDQKAVQY